MNKERVNKTCRLCGEEILRFPAEENVCAPCEHRLRRRYINTCYAVEQLIDMGYDEDIGGK